MLFMQWSPKNFIAIKDTGKYKDDASNRLTNRKRTNFIWKNTQEYVMLNYMLQAEQKLF